MKWISVKERLPEPHTRVLVRTTKGAMRVTNMYRHHIDGTTRWAGSTAYAKSITHWMPLPENPGDERANMEELVSSALPEKEIDWEQRRYEIAKEVFEINIESERAMCERINRDDRWEVLPQRAAQGAVNFADALIDELRKGKE